MDSSSGIVPTMPIGNNGFGGDAGEWIFGLIVLAMFANGGAFGGNNNTATESLVTSQAIQGAIADTNTNLNTGFQNVNTNLNNGFQNTNNALAGGFARTNDNLGDIKTSILTGDMGLSNSVLENRYASELSACQTQRDILTQTNELNTNLLTNALQNQAKMDECCCNIRASGIENTQKILDAISQNTIDNLREQVNDLKNTITAQSTTNNVISQVRPYPVPSYLVSSPYQSLYNGFIGSNWYGNTIV